jgi:hypothetical protein
VVAEGLVEMELPEILQMAATVVLDQHLLLPEFLQLMLLVAAVVLMLPHQALDLAH